MQPPGRAIGCTRAAEQARQISPAAARSAVIQMSAMSVRAATSALGCGSMPCWSCWALVGSGGVRRPDSRNDIAGTSAPKTTVTRATMLAASLGVRSKTITMAPPSAPAAATAAVLRNSGVKAATAASASTAPLAAAADAASSRAPSTWCASAPCSSPPGSSQPAYVQ